MKISVLFPVYKPTPDHLVEAIDSIKNQTYKKFECLFLYDAPTEEISEILNNYIKSDPRFRIIRAADKGLAYALNLGLDASDGEFIARMDADDISYPDRFFLQLKLIKDFNLDVVGGDYLVIDNLGAVVDSRLVPKSHDQIGIVLAKCVPFAHSSVMMRKQSIDTLCLKYNSDGNVIAEDYDLWTRMYLQNLRFGNVAEWILKFRDSDTSLNKKVYSSSIKSARDISKSFIASNINNLIVTSKKMKPHRLDKLNQEALAYLIFKLVFVYGHFDQIYQLKKVTARNKIIGGLAVLNEIFNF